MEDDKLINIAEIAKIPSYNDLEKSADYVNDAVKRIELLSEVAKKHIVDMCVSDKKDLYQSSQYKSAVDQERTNPTGDQVKFVIGKITEKGYTKPEIAKLVGVSATKNRTLDRWAGCGDDESKVPLAAWRLLCAYAGISIDLELPVKEQKVP